MDDLQPEEAMVERLLERLETGIESAASQERFKEASALRDEISRMHMDDSSAVLKVNSDFYRAFSTKNITLMGTVWHNSPHVQCIHPGAKPLVGYDNIVSMWSNMFQARDQVFKGTDITPSDVRVHVRGTSAFVTCTEEVIAPSGAERRMLATNIFRKLEGRWVLVHHHASQATRLGGGNSIEDLLSGSSGLSGTRVIRIDGRDLGSDASSKADSSADDIVDEIVRALQGALEDEQQGKSTSPFEGQVVGSMRFEVETDDDEEIKDTRRRERSRSLDDDEDDIVVERELSEGVTERTVAALRRLAKEGLISREDKRKLLSSVIQHHQKGEEASEIEIAYEILVMNFLPNGVSGGQVAAAGVEVQEDDLLEDFADQCVILAKRLD